MTSPAPAAFSPRRFSAPEGSQTPVSALSVREFSRRWTGRLAHYRSHGNAEHLEALMAEAIRYAGSSLENDLIHSKYWATASLTRRATLLLFLVDRGIVNRTVRAERVVYEAQPDAVNWVLAQPSMIPYLVPTLEFLSAIQTDQCRRARPTQS